MKRKGELMTMDGLSEALTGWAGTKASLVLAVSGVLCWLALGPVFRFSAEWQLVINTVTSVITFVMVFLLQRAQNRSALALQLKLNEIVAALEGASNRLVDVESLDEDELRRLRVRYETLATRARQDRGMRRCARSVDEDDSRG